MKKRNIALPPIGMRIIKSSVGVLLGFIIYFLRGKQGAPFYIALSVLWCMQSNTTNAKINAIQRTIGTFIGALFGLAMILVELYIVPFDNELFRYFTISLLIIPIIYTTVILNKKNASYFSCVVFLSIVVNHLKDSNPYIFVFNRMLDTMIGIGLALVINTVELPKKKIDNTLFVVELDNILLNIKDKMTPYSKFELNKMIQEGINFTISSKKTPASLIGEIKDIKLTLPVIAMDGAVLFDIKDNRYLKVYDISNSEANVFIEFFKKKNVHCFVNTIVEDSFITYYGEFKNEVEKDIYNKNRLSPYRNYIKEELPERYNVVYLMCIDKDEKINCLYDEIEKLVCIKDYKVLKCKSEQYKGYSYIKIYNKNAVKENMIKTIEKMINNKNTIIFENDMIIQENSKNTLNDMVKRLKRMYRPYIWRTNNKDYEQRMCKLSR